MTKSLLESEAANSQTKAKSPAVDVLVSEGSIFLMPKGQSYRLRNVGKEEVTIRIIRIHHTDSRLSVGRENRQSAPRCKAPGE